MRFVMKTARIPPLRAATLALNPPRSRPGCTACAPGLLGADLDWLFARGLLRDRHRAVGPASTTILSPATNSACRRRSARVFDLVLDLSPEGRAPKAGRTLLDDRVLRGIGDRELHLLRGKLIEHPRELEVDDGPDLFTGQAAEDD